MANFKVGDRVRIVDGDDWTRLLGAIGLEGVIVAIPSQSAHLSPRAQCDVAVVGWGQPKWAAFYQLAPLTDPAADAFMERIRKLAREPQPYAKERA